MIGILSWAAIMLTALLDLYKNSSSRTPLERFTTETFCGVLRSDPESLNSFLHDFLGIKNENGFKIFTEKTYENSRIDVVLENKNYLVFLEIKVDSTENENVERNQLETYAEILKNQNKKTILLFCTKYQEIKKPETYKPIVFKQFLWRDIFNCFLKANKAKQNHLAIEFLKFLEKQKMSKAPEFTLDDLTALNRIPNIFKSLEECLDQIRPAFQKHIGNIEPRSLQDRYVREKDLNYFYGQIYKHSRYALWKEYPLKDHTAWSEILACVSMGNQHKDNPKLILSFGVSKGCHEYEKVIIEFNENRAYLEDILLSESEDWFSARFEKSLSDFLSSDQQFSSIKQWFEEKILLLNTYMTQQSQLEWDIKK
jgi:hypothetical protein